MEANKILQADLLDILFENRNKKYGAYELRKEYDARLYKSLAIIFSIVLLLFFLVSRSAKHEKINTVPMIETVLYKIPNAAKPVPKQPIIKTPKSQPTKTNSQLFISKIKIVDSTETATKLSKNLDSTQISSITQTGITGGKPIIKCLNCNSDSGKVVTTVVKTIDKTTPQLTAEVMPMFPGGMDALKKFLERNLTNPANLNEGEIVSVKVQFIVGYDGKLKGFTVLEDGGYEFNQEVIRVLKKMPIWNPGKSQGENVSVYYTIPVKFISSE
jgi:protein TonB